MSQKTSSLAGLGIARSMFAMAAPRSAEAGPKAYVGNFTNNTVSVIDTTTGRVVATIHLPRAAYTGDHQQSLLWRAEAQSAVHDRKQLALCHLREGDRHGAWATTANASLRRPRVANFIHLDFQPS